MNKKKSPESFLSENDNILGELISLFGECPVCRQERELFDSLATAIISQQLSSSASIGISKKIQSLHGRRPFKAAQFLELSDNQLSSCGLSKNKIKSIKGIAKACIREEITKNVFASLDDEAVVEKLTSYYGVGRWTAEIFMMCCLQRTDMIAFGDVGLKRAHNLLYPNSENLRQTSEKWRPYRAVAAWYLWKFIDNTDCHNEVLKKVANS